MPPNISDAVIILKDRKEWPDPRLEKEELIARFEEVASRQIGNNFEFSQPIELRFNELISGVRTDLAVMVYGDDFATMNATADQIAGTAREGMLKGKFDERGVRILAVLNAVAQKNEATPAQVAWPGFWRSPA